MENSQAFAPEEVEKGLDKKFLDVLLELSQEMEDPLDIRIWSDGYCRVINWCSTDKYSSEGYVYLQDGEFVTRYLTCKNNPSVKMLKENVISAIDDGNTNIEYRENDDYYIDHSYDEKNSSEE